MKKNILYLHGRPDAHNLHKNLANSVTNHAEYVDFKYRWQDMNYGTLNNLFAWVYNSLFYRKFKDYDVILVDGLHFSPVIAKKFGLLKRNTILISHMGNQLPYFIFTNKLGYLSKKAHLWLLENYDHLLCEGLLIRDLITTISPNIQARLKVVYTGPSHERLIELKKIKVNLNSNCIITIAGGPGSNRIYYKGLDVMVKGFVQARRNFPDMDYYILGDWDKDDQNNLLNGITEDDKNHIHFVGNQTNIVSYSNWLSKCALCIHVSRGDAFPGSTIEVMAIGMPILISEYTGTKEIIKNVHDNLVIHLSSDVIAEKILWYLSLTLTEKQLISEKLILCAKDWTEERSIQHYKLTFDEILNKRIL